MLGCLAGAATPRGWLPGSSLITYAARLRVKDFFAAAKKLADLFLRNDFLFNHILHVIMTHRRCVLNVET